MNPVNRRGSNLPSELVAPARRALDAAGYVRLEQLASVSEAELAPLHGIGPNALKQLCAVPSPPTAYRSPTNHNGARKRQTSLSRRKPGDTTTHRHEAV